MADLVDSLLKIANSPVLQQFLHDCVDDLTGAKQANFDNYNSDIEWTIQDFNAAKSSIQKFYRESLMNNNFEVGLNLGDNAQQEIKKCLEIRKDDIFQALVKEKLVNNGHKLVDNIDWRLKWILGNSKLAAIREPLLQVDLHCLNRGEAAHTLNRDTVSFEMNLETLDRLIEQLQKVTKELNENNK